MAQNTYYPEEVLIEKMERGEYGWLDYVNHFSAEWQEELVDTARRTRSRLTIRQPSNSSTTRVNN